MIKTLWTLAPVFLLSACAPNEAPGDPSDQEPTAISWTKAIELIPSGKVNTAAQTHSLRVFLIMMDGSRFSATEPNIDEVFREIRNCGAPCADIAMITE